MVYEAPMITFDNVNDAARHMVLVDKALVADMNPGKNVRVSVRFSNRRSMARVGICKYKGDGLYEITHNVGYIYSNLRNPYYFHDHTTHECAHTVHMSHDWSFKALCTRYGVPDGVTRNLVTSPWRAEAPIIAVCERCGVLNGTETWDAKKLKVTTYSHKNCGGGHVRFVERSTLAAR